MAVNRIGRGARLWLASGVAAAAVTTAAAAQAEKKKDDVAGMFDPEALERGAKALREINSSPHAKQVGA